MLDGGLSATGVSKSFYGNRVLDRFQIEILPGQVHALLGHNGSGKSTFIKILAGYHTPDNGSGPIEVGGRTVVAGDPEDTAEAGITFVHQTLGLIPELTVLENLHLGVPWETEPGWRIPWSKERATARDLLKKFDLGTSPDAIVENLSTVEQTEIAIVRALSRGNEMRVLVLDEPTAALTDLEVNRLFETLERVRSRGVSILYVTHRLEEIARIADQVTILRDGKTVGQGPVGAFPRERLISLITEDVEVRVRDAGPGRDPVVVEDVAAEGPPNGNKALLSVSGLRSGELAHASYEGRAGEVLGAVGLLGSGALDLAQVLTGRSQRDGGSVRIDGEIVDVGNFAQLSRRGVGAVVGERGHRVVMDLTLQENLTLGALSSFFLRGFLRTRAIARSAKGMIGEYEIRAAGPNVSIASLSGGNQQKAAIAKVLATNPKVLVLEEPCHGVDERGRQEIRAILRRAADAGALVFVIDSDMDEVVGLCTRVLVFRDGRITDEVSGVNITRRRLLDACYGSDNREDSDAG